jgi:small-conductance mechanosensitive channel
MDMDAHEALNPILQVLPGAEISWLMQAYEILFIILASAIVWLVLRFMLASAEKRIVRYEFLRINQDVFKLFRKVIFYLLFMFTGTLIIRLLNIQVAERAFHAAIVIALAFPVKEFVILLMAYLEKSVAGKTETRIDDILFDLLNRFSGAIIFATAIVLALDVLGINVMPFVAGAGVAGVAIGFAAKDTLSNLIAGVLLIIDRPFEVGDRIEVWSAPSELRHLGRCRRHRPAGHPHPHHRQHRDHHPQQRNHDPRHRQLHGHQREDSGAHQRGRCL